MANSVPGDDTKTPTTAASRRRKKTVTAASLAPKPAVPAHPAAPSDPIIQRVLTMSDRAIQRVVGGNAFLRGRMYAKRKAIDELTAKDDSVQGQIKVRSAEEPYLTKVSLGEENAFVSQCNCPGWRGPDNHCKHVAGVLVALRDKHRPPKAPGQKNGKKKRKGTDPNNVVHVPQTVSAGGKRRRSRRRKRGGSGKLEVLSGAALRGNQGESRGAFDAWLPVDARRRPHQFEYRVQVRPSSVSVTVTTSLSEQRTAVPVVEALQSFNSVAGSERALFRTLARNLVRGKTATAEVRGEEAAEVLSMLQTRRVIIDPASMELRFSDEALHPKIELDRLGDGSLRTQVVFVQPSSGRRFPMTQGAWFEGTPGWYIDPSDGFARPLADKVSPEWLTRLSRSPSLAHPADQLSSMLTEHLPRVAGFLGAETPDLSEVADVVDADPEFEMRATGDIVGVAVRMRVTYRGEEFDVPLTMDDVTPFAFLPSSDERPKVVRRDVGAELSAVNSLNQMNLKYDEEADALVARGPDAIAFWSNGIAELPDDWTMLIPDDLAEVEIRKGSVTPQMRVSSGVDWLSMDMSFSADGTAVTEEALRDCLENGRRLVKLEDGSYAPVDPDKVEHVLRAMAEIYADGERKKKLPLSQAGRLEALLDLVPNAKATTAAKTLFNKLDNVDKIKKVAKPRSLKATLRPYQKQGFSWLVFLHELASGGILADDMGLGKTVQTIALLAWAKSKEKQKLNLVVAPTSVAPNWEREINKFAPGLKTVIWQGPKRFDREDELKKADVMITSYALLRRDEELLQSLDLRYVILDEAQHIKNPASHTARAAKKIPSERRLALTGTPIENRLSEMWSIFDFVSPGLLGELKQFESKIARPIDNGDMVTAKRLRNTIKPFVLRRLKSDVAHDLPAKIEMDRIVPLADAQKDLYGQILKEVKKKIDGEVKTKGIGKSQIQILAALTRLRQVACDPRLMKLENDKFSHDDSGKLNALREILAEAISGGHRVLIFSQFVSMLNLMKRALTMDKIKYEYLDGSTKDRLAKVDSFNEDESIPVFLISLKAGGTGLNLTGADTVIHFDPWWNPAVEDQATDRAHRIGQTKVVTVYRLIAEGTVEEKILKLSAKKRQLVGNVLSTEGTPLKGLTKKDVEDLFSV